MEVSVTLKTSKSFFPNAYMIPGPLGLHLPGLLSRPHPAKEGFCWADKPGIVPSVSDTLTKEALHCTGSRAMSEYVWRITAVEPFREPDNDAVGDV
ncbi:uncharacterized, partial [Tachysurus ichikawai]